MEVPIYKLSKPGGGNVTEPGVEPTSSGCMTGDRTTDLKRSAVMSGIGIHRLIYRDICVAASAHNTDSSWVKHLDSVVDYVTHRLSCFKTTLFRGYPTAAMKSLQIHELPLR